MLDTLEEFNKELTQVTEVIHKIEELPVDLQDMMMKKFKTEVIGKQVEVKPDVTVKQSVKKEETVKQSVKPEETVKKSTNKSKRPIKTDSLNKILACLPLLTHKEAEKEVNKIREKYIHAPQKRKIELLSEIPCKKWIMSQTRLSDTTVKNWLENYNDSLVNLGVVGKINLTGNLYNSPAFYYKIKQETGDIPILDNTLNEVQSMEPEYTYNSNPYHTGYPWQILKEGKPYTYHNTKKERDEAWEIGEKTDWDKARMYKLPSYVIYYGNNLYSIFIPKTNRLFRERATLQEVKNFIAWLEEAEDYNGGADVKFKQYYRVSPSRTINGFPAWKYSYHNEYKARKTISGRTLDKLSENMDKKGFKLSQSIGYYIIDLEEYI